MFQVLIDFANTLIAGVAVIINSVLALLPNSPFTWDFSALNSYGYFKVISWVLPLQGMASLLGAFLGAVVTYYVYSVIMRKVGLIK